MGRKGTGVEIRGKAIRIQFSLNGENRAPNAQA